MKLRIRDLTDTSVVALLFVAAIGCGTDQIIGQGQAGLGGTESAGGAEGTGGSETLGSALATGGALVTGAGGSTSAATAGAFATGGALTTGGAQATGGARAAGGSTNVATGGASCVGDGCPPPVTCELQGVTYAVGASVGACVCLPDGTIGNCGGVARGCARYGRGYAVGESFSADCGTCICKSDGSWGDCTGSCTSCSDKTASAAYTACTSASDEESCEAMGGDWTVTRWEGVPTGVYHCACITGDEGCPCDGTEDCVAGCYYSGEHPSDVTSCTANPLGQCGKFRGGCAVVVSTSSCYAICE